MAVGKIAPERIARMVDNHEAQVYVNHPAHGAVMLRLMKAELDSLLRSPSDDPAIFAYAVRDSLRRMQGHLNAASRWSHAVIEAFPDDIPDHGAQLCHSRRLGREGTKRR